MTHEIVNLQFGNYSNYVGSHFWNIQESQFVYEYNHNSTKSIPDVNHDVLFREGLNIHNQITYTPRLILFDFKENIGKVNLFNQFIETQQQQNKQRTKPTWNGQIEVFKQDKREVSKLDLENHQIEELAKEVAANSSQILAASSKAKQPDDDKKIEFWSDYSNTKYHDRSYMLLNASQATKTNTGSTDEEIFDLYTHGIDAFKSPLFAEEFEDSFRHFVEECDLVQGFQMSIDAFNGFGGLATQSFGFINDEFPKSSIMTFMLFPHQHNHSKESSNIKLINTMLTLRGLLEEKNDLTVVPLSMFSSFYSEKDRLKPIDLYSVKYNPSVDYHTSAILASLIDSTTLPWRQKSQKTNMSDLFEQVDMYKYKIGSLQALYPFWLDKPNNYLFDYLRESDLLKDATHFSPMCGKSVDNDDDDDDVSGFLNVVCRGIENNQSKNEKDNYYFNGIVPAHSVLDKYLVDMYPKSKSKSYSIEARLNTSSPYPKIIDEKINRTNQIALLTALQFNKKIFNWLDYMNRSIELMKIQKEMLYYSSSFEEDDFVNLKVFNQDLCDIYSS